jgi:hypothetical protein
MLLLFPDIELSILPQEVVFSFQYASFSLLSAQHLHWITTRLERYTQNGVNSFLERIFAILCRSYLIEKCFHLLQIKIYYFRQKPIATRLIILQNITLNRIRYYLWLYFFKYAQNLKTLRHTSFYVYNFLYDKPFSLKLEMVNYKSYWINTNQNGIGSTHFNTDYSTKFNQNLFSSLVDESKRTGETTLPLCVNFITPGK